jgi:hypothetical protein
MSSHAAPAPTRRPFAGLRTWLTMLAICLEERLAYRGDFILGTLMRFLPIVTQVFLWTAVFAATSRADIAGYSRNDIVAYYLLTMVTRAFSSMPGLAGGIARSVSAPVIADGSPPSGAPLDSSLFGPAGIAIGGAATAALRSAVTNSSSEQQLLIGTWPFTIAVNSAKSASVSVKPPSGSPTRESKPADTSTSSGLNRAAAGRSRSRNAPTISFRPLPAGNGQLIVRPSPAPRPVSPARPVPG